MTELEFAKRAEAAGGRAYIVGGWVRDRVREVPAARSHDRDYVLEGFSPEDIPAVFAENGVIPQAVGKSFPVYLMKIDGQTCEVALCRTERKTGTGYTGFAVCANGDVSIEEDLHRRDTTMNSMAIDILTDEIIDPYGGQRDIKKKIIRRTGEHFAEDPLRALRAARQAAELGFEIDDDTLEAMEELAEELKTVSSERIVGELMRVLTVDCEQGGAPERFFIMLRRANLVETVFPELYALIGKEQPANWHPEGDSWNHTMLTFALACRKTTNVTGRFAALVHDLGKGLTPAEVLPHHYGHELRGLDALRAWNDRMTLPNDLVKAGEFAIHEHMRAARLAKPGKITELLVSIDKVKPYLTADDFILLLVIDGGMRFITARTIDHLDETLGELARLMPPYLYRIDEFLQAIRSVRGSDAPEYLCGPAVGEWIYEERLRLVKRLLRKYK